MEIWQIVLGIVICIWILSLKRRASNTDVYSTPKPWEDEELGSSFWKRTYTPETDEQRQRRIDLHPDNQNLPPGSPKLDWDSINEDPETGRDFHWIREQREKGRNI